MGRIDDFYVVKPVIAEPKPEIVEVKPQTTDVSSRQSLLNENRFQGNLLRFKLTNSPAYFGGGGSSSPAPATSGGLFADGYEGAEGGTDMAVSPLDENARPEEVVQYLKYYPSPGWTEADEGVAFAQALELHQGDEEWIRTFLHELGPDTVESYLSQSFNQSPPSITAEQVSNNADAIRSALELMVDSGDLTQEGINNLLDGIKDGNAYVFTEIFGKSSNATLNEMFVNAAIANGDDRLEAAAAQVMTNLSPEKQVEILSSLAQQGKLNDFIRSAMAGQEDIIDFNYNYSDPKPNVDEIPYQKLSGITQLLTNAGIESGYNGSTFQEALYPQELQEQLFFAASEALTDSSIFEKFESDVYFKNSLSKVFLNNFDAIFKNSISENGASITGTSGWLSAFFENSLFAQPPSSLASDVLATVYSKVAGLAKATDLIASGKQPLTAEEQQLVDDFYASSPEGAEWSTNEAAGVIGEWMGNFDRAYTRAVGKIEGDAAANASLLKTVIGAIDKLTGLATLSTGQTIAKDFLTQLLNELPSYVQGREISDGKAEISDSADVITDLNNRIWDLINPEDQQKYSDNFEFIAKHKPSESGLG